MLLAFCAAQLLAQIPITPGGLGVVEAGLTGFLVVIGVPAGAAAVATLAYRLSRTGSPCPPAASPTSCTGAGWRREVSVPRMVAG